MKQLLQMKRTVRTTLLVLLVSAMGIVNAQVSIWNGSWEPWTLGTGTETDPFLIQNAQQLAYLAYRVNNGLDAGDDHISDHNYHYKLMVDVNLNGNEDFQWTPIGYWNSDTDHQSFGSHFDGNNHSITNLYINSEAHHVGLFGVVDGATIMQIHINSGSISTTSENAGGLIGVSTGSSNIIHCSNNSTVVSNGNTGGIIGIISTANGTTHVLNCQNSGNVTSVSSGYSSTGGIIGDIYQCSNSIIENCFNTGHITSSGWGSWRYVGGIVALNHYSYVSITNCYNTGTVTNTGNGHSRYASGIIGANNTYDANVKNSYNVGDIVVDNGSIGAIGFVQGGGLDISNSYYLSTCSGSNMYGGEAMTSTQMRDPQFVATLNQGQTTSVWKSDYSIPINDGYPILEWQQSTGVDENEALSAAVYPNPTTNHITIEAEGIKYITISNLLGQIIYESNASGDEFNYGFSEQETGIYLIRIETASGVATKRIILMK